MERSLTRLATAVGAVAILCWPAVASAADTKQDVRVVNTPAEAVPVAVQGTATVTGGVQVTNTPTVALDPSQNGVQVTNPVTSPVPAALQPDDLTHLRRKASDHVVLLCREYPRMCSRRLPDGRSEEDWVVPAGKVLVLTDIDWVRSQSAGIPAGTVQFRLWAGIGGASTVEYSFIAPYDGNGNPHGEHHLTSGIIIPAGYTLRSPQLDLFFSYLYGYLAADQ